MSSEEFKRKMDFILDKQAQFASNLCVLEGIVTQLAKTTPNRFKPLGSVSTM